MSITVKVRQYGVTAHKEGWKSYIHTFEREEESYARAVANRLSSEGWSVWFSTLEDGNPVLATTNDLDFVFGTTKF